MASIDLIGGDRPLRGCDICGGVDDHPRHAIAGDANLAPPAHASVVEATLRNLDRLGLTDGDPERTRILDSILNTAVVDFHMDCCRANGCPTGTCNDVADIVGEHARGEALLAGIEQPAATAAIRERTEIRLETLEG